MIVGVAAAGPLFTEEILKAMGVQCDRPIIFALSNPDEKMECTAEDAQKHTGVLAALASGTLAASQKLEHSSSAQLSKSSVKLTQEQYRQFEACGSWCLLSIWLHCF